MAGQTFWVHRGPKPVVSHVVSADTPSFLGWGQHGDRESGVNQCSRDEDSDDLPAAVAKQLVLSAVIDPDFEPEPDGFCKNCQEMIVDDTVWGYDDPSFCSPHCENDHEGLPCPPDCILCKSYLLK